ncbi:MAG: proline dehydrogenase [Candidatus Marinimicrobia bacterium]|nr:proline dehydrogenase [Candidatus Neomarinimicrobiota bacterium]
MFFIFNKLIILTIPILPKFFVKIFANKYVAGIKTSEAINVVKKLNQKNLTCTLDILGEHTKSKHESNAIANKYVDIFEKLEQNKLDCNISVKPSHIGSDVDNKVLKNNIKKLIDAAKKNNNFLRIDMEDSNLTELSINIYKENFKKKSYLGIVLQAYLKRTESDIENLDSSSNIRLCKGIYNEDKSISFKKPIDINKNFLNLLDKALEKNIYVGIATHDEKLIKSCLEIIELKKINKKNIEFQMLYGVPMDNVIKKLMAQNFKIRIYVPYGKNWYDYSIRRIKENPNISKYIIKNLFK